MNKYFTLAGRIAKIHSEERPEERTLPSGTRLVPEQLEPGVWVFRKEREAECG